MTSTQIEPIEEGDAVLRMLSEPDLPITLGWRNDEASRHWFQSTDLISAAQHRAWFARYLERDDDFVFVMELAGIPVAQVSVYDIDGGGAEFGRLLVDPAARGQRLARRAVSLCLRVADDVLLIDTLQLVVKADNVRALRVYVAAGFDAVQDAPADLITMRRRRP